MNSVWWGSFHFHDFLFPCPILKIIAKWNPRKLIEDKCQEGYNELLTSAWLCFALHSKSVGAKVFLKALSQIGIGFHF